MTMTDERLAELDAVMAMLGKAPLWKTGQWFERNAADIRAHIDAQAATIAANTEREIHLTYVLKGLLGAYEAIVRQTGKDDLLRDDAPTWRNTARAALTGAA